MTRPPPVTRPGTRRPLGRLVTVTVLGCAIGAAGIALAVHLRRGAAPPPWAAVAATHAARGPIDGCLSIVTATTAPAATALAIWDDVPPPEIPGAVLDLEARLVQGPDPAAAPPLAAALLLLDQGERAVALLASEAQQRGDAALWSDLAAAHLHEGRRTKTIEPIVRALDAASRAVLIDPQHAAGWFNRALAAGRLHLSGLARESLAQATSSPCGPPAASVLPAAPDATPPREERLAALVQHIDEASLDTVLARLGDSADLAAEILERRVLGQWAVATGTGAHDASDAHAARARALAARLSTTTSDRFWLDVVAELTHASSAGLADAWLAYLEAVDALEAEAFDAVAAPLARAERLIPARFAALSAALALERASSLRLVGRPDESRRILTRLLPQATSRSWWRIAGRAEWQLGLLVEETGALGDSLVRYTEASRLLARSGDRESLAVVRVRLARFYQQIDERAGAWRLMAEALADLPQARRYRRDAILRGAAIMAGGLQLHAAALAFQEQPLQEALAARSAGGLAFLYPDRARAFQALGLDERAADQLAQGRRWLEALADPRTADMARAIQFRTEAVLARATGAEAELAALTRALQLFRDRGNEFATPEIQLGRAQALRRLGRPTEADLALAEGVATLERRRDTMLTRMERVRVAALSWSLYRERADLALQARGSPEALDILERGRAFLAPRHLTGSPPLPAGVAIVAYAVLPSGAFGLIRMGSAERYFTVAASDTELTQEIARFRGGVIDGRPEEARDAGVRLADALLRPIANDLDQARTLIVVADPLLTSLPFAALPSPVTGQPLVDAHHLVLAPSLAAATRRRPKRPASLAALVLGDPETHPDLALPRLHASRREALGVSALYQSVTPHLGKLATKPSLVTNAPAAALIHFGGHALADEAVVSLSRLIVAPSPDDPAGVVFERDISELDLAATRIVVLAACDTGRSGQAAGPAVFGFARTFLDAGASAVVATLWPVADEPASVLFLRLHQRLRDGVPVATALAEVQAERRREGASPAEWAGVVVIGENVTAQE